MPKYRRTRRSPTHSANRHANRLAIRVRWRAPDDLGTALDCFRRALRAHRRLARLAPRFFDSTVIERERRDDEARRRWRDSCTEALNKIYGFEPTPSEPPVLPPLPSPRTRIIVERELASAGCWLRLGSDARRRYQLRRPHDLVSLDRLRRLYEIGFNLARLATGYDPARPQPAPVNYEGALADLERIYGATAIPTDSGVREPSA